MEHARRNAGAGTQVDHRARGQAVHRCGEGAAFSGRTSGRGRAQEEQKQVGGSSLGRCCSGFHFGADGAANNSLSSVAVVAGSKLSLTRTVSPRSSITTGPSSVVQT